MNTINEDPFEYDMSSMENEFDSFNGSEFNQEIGENIDDLKNIDTMYSSDVDDDENFSSDDKNDNNQNIKKDVHTETSTQLDTNHETDLVISESVDPEFDEQPNTEIENTSNSDSLSELQIDDPKPIEQNLNIQNNSDIEKPTLSEPVSELNSNDSRIEMSDNDEPNYDKPKETVKADFTELSDIKPKKTTLSDSINETSSNMPKPVEPDFTKPMYTKPNEQAESNFKKPTYTAPKEIYFKNDEPPVEETMSIELQPRDKRELISLARYALSERLKHHRIELKTSDSPNLQQICGAFVTLKRLGHLRGCIGRIFGKLPIYETIQKMAIQAGFYDTRFKSLTKEELALTDIEISILTPLKHISSVDEIIVGKHGVFIQKELSSGLLLPQVAIEETWDKNELLENLCFKAKLPNFAWKSADLFTFESIIIKSD
ncbi:AmmeMemoRadiSam system protein A [bacterium]|jgi:uncharacterized protein|nr:AmmeMemoRadiSam system protein A [bacterium]